MATSFICDGCGKPMAEARKVGRVLVRDYCDACEPKAVAFADAEEALRKRLVETFTTDRALLVAQTGEGGFKLPDVP